MHDHAVMLNKKQKQIACNLKNIIEMFSFCLSIIFLQKYFNTLSVLQNNTVASAFLRAWAAWPYSHYSESVTSSLCFDVCSYLANIYDFYVMVTENFKAS